MRRVVELEGCLNFRDVGGYPTADGRRVRWRRVFRSDALHRLTPADVVRLRDELQVGTVIDLRSSEELRAEGRGQLASEAIGFRHLPLFEGDTTRAERPQIGSLGELYVVMAEVARARIAEVLGAIADAEGPAVFHCAAGKDRTGVVSAVLLGILGVPDELIVADYAASRENLDAIVERLLASEGYRTMLATLPADTMHAEAETMRTFLAAMRARHGSMQAYARGGGLDDGALERLVARLLEG